MKIFENSILEVIASPLRIFYSSVREPSIYEHVFGPVVIAEFLRHLPPLYKWIGFGVLALFHLVLKEFVYDLKKNGSIHWPNVVERSYGLALGAIVVIV